MDKRQKSDRSDDINKIVSSMFKRAADISSFLNDTQKTTKVIDAIQYCIHNKTAAGTERDSNSPGYREDEETNSRRPKIMWDPVFYVRNSSVKIMSGNILDSKCDVIVSSDDDLITHGGGVSNAIFERGGKSIHYDARKNIPAKLGDVVVTSAGKLIQKYIFHAITLTLAKNQMSSTLSPKEEADIQNFIISNAIQRSFYLLSALELSSIAFPVIGTGAAKIPFQNAIIWMLENFAAQLQKTARPLHVELWIYHNHHGYDVNSIAEKILTQSEPEQIALPRSSAPAEYDVFVSYSRKDSKTTEELIGFLKSKNLRIWQDTDKIRSGDNYKSKIVSAIQHSKTFIFISSKNSNQSENVPKEVALAVKKHIPVIPFKIDSAPYVDEIAYDITNIDFITLNEENAFEKLYIAVASKLKSDCASIIDRACAEENIGVFKPQIC